MSSDRANTNSNTLGGNHEVWVWVFLGCGIGLAFLSALVATGRLAATIPFIISVAFALRIIRSLKKEIADLKSGDADVSTATQDSE